MSTMSLTGCYTETDLDTTILSKSLAVPLIDLFKDVLKPAIILLKDGVLGAHVQRPLLVQGILKAAVSKISNRLRKRRLL